MVFTYQPISFTSYETEILFMCQYAYKQMMGKSRILKTVLQFKGKLVLPILTKSGEG